MNETVKVRNYFANNRTFVSLRGGKRERKRERECERKRKKMM